MEAHRPPGDPAYRERRTLEPRFSELLLPVGLAVGVAAGALVYAARLVRDDWYQSARLDQRPVVLTK